MKNYSHIASKLFYEPLLLTPARHAAICQLVEARIAAGPAADTTVHVEQDEEEEQPTTVGETRIIPVHGTIVPHASDLGMSECGCPLDELNAAIDLAEHDPDVGRIIFDFRSPGGAVTGIPETGRRIYRSSKETIAFTGSDCCSGALWLAEQCQQFYATASSRVGSVGVYTMYLDLSRKMQNEGEAVNAIFAGKYKLLGAYWKPMADEERAILQRRVDKIYAEFKAAVETFRQVSDEHMGNGLVFDGEEAAELGFTDGTVEDLEEILDGMV